MTTIEMQSYVSNLGLTEAEMGGLFAALGDLKAFTFQRVNRRGTIENCYCSADNLLGDFSGFQITVTFSNHESFEKKEANYPPAPESFVLRLSNVDFWREVLKPPVAEDRDKSLLVILSNTIWRLALETKFIEDWSTFDLNGKPQMVKKSLAELGAVEA